MTAKIEQKSDGKWFFDMSIPPHGSLGGPSGTVTVNGNTLTHVLVGPNHRMEVVVKVSGNQLVGSYTLRYLNIDAAQPQTATFQGTRK